MTSLDLPVSGPAWPTCALGAWAAAWRSGHCSPDDVADVLGEFADRHILDDAESPAPVGADDRLAILALLRRASSIGVRLPSAGAPQGLPPGAATTAAFHSGEVLVVDDGGHEPLALLPTLGDTVCRWALRRFPAPPAADDGHGLGQVEYDLIQAVREGAEIIGRLGDTGVRSRSRGTDIRTSIARMTTHLQVLMPPHDNSRATRILESAAQVEAVLRVATSNQITVGATAVHHDLTDGHVRQLFSLTRSARAAAVNAVIRDFAR